jgi:hypothetical protein
MRLNHLITIGLVSVVSSTFGLVGISEAKPVAPQPQQLLIADNEPYSESGFVPDKDDVFYKLFFYYGGDFFNQVSIGGQLNNLFGWTAFSHDWKALPLGAFPENQLMENAKLLNRVYHDALYQQVSSDPIIRTRDFNNPFDTSLMENPCYTRLTGQPCSVR